MGFRDAIRESSDLGAILTMSPDERPVLFYAEDSFTWVQYEGYVNALRNLEVPLVYVSSQRDDPVLGSELEGMSTFFIDKQLPRLFERLDSTVVVMTMPDLGVFHVPKPPNCDVVYVFHSLNSAHTSYRSGAFDHYDHFLCTGPHHVAEIGRLNSMRGQAEAKLHEVGYYKLDRIAEAHDGWSGKEGGAREVLLAPSWAPGNLLEAHGEAIVSSLLDSGFRVTIRPHPQFFHSLYPEGSKVVSALQSRFKKVDGVDFELSIDTEDSFHRSDLMVSDWSGAAFEYALGTLRPVLFVDTPQKLFNQQWEDVGLPAFERRMRSEVGSVIAGKDVATIGSIAESMILDRSQLSEGLSALRDDLVFNFGSSSAAGAQVVKDLVE